MKWQTAPAFDADLRRLRPDELNQFREVVRKAFVPAAERRAVEGTGGIWEMTWSFSGPDGRATFEWIEIEGEPAIRWRRVGGHEIFRDPAR